MNLKQNFCTGISALDETLQCILPGDNIVFQVDSINDYIHFVHAFCRKVNIDKKKLIYLRFAQHVNLLPDDVTAKVFVLNPELGFEHFISQIIEIIEEFGVGACYIFDSLSDLAADWYSDPMLSNFFMLICPYLNDFKTVAYFALLRHYHDPQIFTDIHNTAQIVLDVYRNKEEIYIRPIKVLDRFSPTIFMLHKWEDSSDIHGKFYPVKESAIIAEVLSSKHYQWLDLSTEYDDAWHLSFKKAEETLQGLISGAITLKEAEPFKNRLLRSAIVQDDLMLILAMQYFDLEELLTIRKRMIGTGFIGGKSVGMLLSRSILKKKNPKWTDKLEIQDSFYIGSCVYYTFLVKNGCWWMRRKLSNPATFLKGVEEARQKILEGTFSPDIIQQFKDMLNYFGQSPIIVRSSSLQEDSYGHAFAGKYESIFLANQGTQEERLNHFLAAIRTVYASTISEDALNYRKIRGLLEKDEQMALLVQRVSGSKYGRYFFPQIAGVGYSFNPYVWNKKINPKSGFLRLVFGIGTRAVNRIDDDYTRLIALNVPTMRPETNQEDIRRYSQWKVDVLDLENNKFITHSFKKIVEEFKQSEKSKEFKEMHVDLYASRDLKLEERATKLNKEASSLVLTFKKLISDTQFITDMREMLKILENAYVIPVDIEFTANFLENGQYKINLLQCRPYQLKKERSKIKSSVDEITDSGDQSVIVILQTGGPIIGNSIAMTISTIIYVEPSQYGNMPLRDKFSIARLIGKINQLNVLTDKDGILLIGPGRWGSSSAHLGVPVNYAEINNFSGLCEIAKLHDGINPDFSLGTHFFNNIVELELFYFTIHPKRKNDIIKWEFFEKSPNLLGKLIPDAKKWEHVVKIIQADKNNNQTFNIILNSLTQKGVCYLNNPNDRESKNKK
ncbi:MAG: PEP/pyruvate-binding domain-containing protein [Promethearchaeota archaeon]